MTKKRSSKILED